MSIQVTTSSNLINAKNRFDLDLITCNQINFVNVKYRISDDKIIFIYDAEEDNILVNKKLNRYEKLIVLYNVLKLYGSANQLHFDLSPDNIVVDDNLDVRILNRDINYQGQNNFINQWKALLGCGIDGKYKYGDYLNGGIDLLKHNQLLNSYYDLNDIQQIKSQLSIDIKNLRQDQNEKFISIKKSSFRNSKVIKVILSILLAITIFVSIVLGINTYKGNKINQMQTYFIQEQYSDVVDKSKTISIKDLSKVDKYIIAYSYVKLETLPENVSNNIINNININSNEDFLDYWVYLARNNFENANNKALTLNDQSLLVYSYLKEIDYITNSDKYNSKEKDEKIKELEGKIKEAGYELKG